MNQIKQIIPWIFVGFILVLLASFSAWTDSLTLVLSQGAQAPNDSVGWAQLGADATSVPATFGATSSGGLGVTGTLGGPNSLTAVVCPASPCSWTGGFTAGDTVVWTSDAGNSGNGPLTLAFAHPVSGVGALIQADGPAQFTVKITAFNGGTTLGSFSQTSDSNGGATYLGVIDNSGANITSISYQLTAASEGDLGDFAIDTLSLNDSTAPSPTPTPSLTPTPTPTVVGPTPTPTLTPTPTATPTPLPSTSLTGSPATLDFKNVDATASSKTKELTLNNEGAATAQIGQIVPPASFSLSDDLCSNTTLAVEKKCTVDLTFAPTAVAAVNEALMIPYNGTSPSETLIGNGLAVTLKAPNSVKLPSTTAGAIGKAKNITIKNKSTATVTLGAAGLTGNFVITSDGCAGATLGPKSGKCVVTMEFAPAGGSSGTLSGTLSYPFTYGTNSGIPVSVPLTGKVKS